MINFSHIFQKLKKRPNYNCLVLPNKQAQICADLVAKVAAICFLVLKEGVHLLQYLKNHLNAQLTHFKLFLIS